MLNHKLLSEAHSTIHLGSDDASGVNRTPIGQSQQSASGLRRYHYGMMNEDGTLNGALPDFVGFVAASASQTRALPNNVVVAEKAGFGADRGLVIQY